MRIAVLICRLLLGFVFVLFGLNGFLNFIPQPPIPPGLMADFNRVMRESHYLVLPFAIQLLSGVLFLIGQYIPLALVLIGPVIVNILMFHVLLAPAGIAPGVVVAILWCVVAYANRDALAGIFWNQRSGS